MFRNAFDIRAYDVIDEELNTLNYTSSNLKGLTVVHDLSSFDSDQILILKDTDVLGNPDDLELECVDLREIEKAEENKKRKRDKAYSALNEQGDFTSGKLLPHYDEEIDGVPKKVLFAPNTSYLFVFI